MKDNRPFSHEDWLATPKPVRESYEQLESMVQLLLEQVTELKDRVEKLENQLNKNSNNSSKPPSSDPPYKKPQKAPSKTKGKKRKRGGQKGHPGHQQKLLPANHELFVSPNSAHVVARPLTRLISPLFTLIRSLNCLRFKWMSLITFYLMGTKPFK